MNVTNSGCTEDLGIMLQLSSKEIGDKIYKEYLAKYEFKRTAYPGDNYHVTVGFVRKVRHEHIVSLKNLFQEKLQPYLSNLNFTVAGCTTLASKNPFIVALPSPEEHKQLLEINKATSEILGQFNRKVGTDYALNDMTHPTFFFPHLTLNGQYGIQVECSNIATTLSSLSEELKGLSIPLNAVVVD